MGRPVNPNVPEDGYKSKRQFEETGNIAAADFSIADTIDSTKKIAFDAGSGATTKTTTIKAGAISNDITLTLPATTGTIALTGGATDSFTIMQPITGTSPTADSAADTLNFASADGSIAIAGNSSTDTLDFSVVDPTLSFKTITCPAGTSPVADSKTDTLTLAGTNVTVTGNSTTDTITFSVANDQTGLFETPVVKSYTIDLAATTARTISTLACKLTSGTATLSIKINGTAVTGMSALSITSSSGPFTATALNSVAVDDVITIDVTAVSSPVDLKWRLKYIT